METAALTLCYETASGQVCTIRQVFISQQALNSSGVIKSLHISLLFGKTISCRFLVGDDSLKKCEKKAAQRKRKKIA